MIATRGRLVPTPEEGLGAAGPLSPERRAELALAVLATRLCRDPDDLLATIGQVIALVEHGWPAPARAPAPARVHEAPRLGHH